jgi:glycosyltransferase involved in cell wall biosynthesis
MYRTPTAEAAFREMVAARTYDLAVVEQIVMASWLPLLRKAGIRSVYDAHNVEAELAADLETEAGAALPGRFKARMLHRRMQQVERALVGGADIVWACSAIDAEALQRLYAPRRPITVVPNAVDVAAFAEVRARQAAPPAPDAPIRLVYTGTLSYPPNEDAALTLVRELLPALRAAGERVRLSLVGRNPTEAIKAAAAGDPDVEVTGPVPSILPWLAEPCLMPMPIRLGSGTRLKILEAFAAGAAVISTAKGAEGIEGVDGRDLRVAERVEEFTAAIRGLWHDQATRLAQTAAAFRLVDARYSWEAAARASAASLGAAPA